MSEVKIENIAQARNHIRHMIQENEGIQLSDKSVYDITETIIAINKHDLEPSINNMRSEKAKNLMLSKKIKELEAFIVENMSENN